MRHPMATAIVAGVGLWGPLAANAQDWHGILGDIADRAAHKAADKAMDKATEPAQPSGSNSSNGANGSNSSNAPAGTGGSQPGAPGAAAPASAGQGAAQGSFKSYQNYDFVPGDQIVFDDDFRADTDGEFPGHWKLLKGYGAGKPIDSNSTPEGKANNRRVELVKV